MLFRFLCVLLSHISMVRLGGARLRALVSLLYQSVNPSSLATLFDSSRQDFLSIKRESIMNYATTKLLYFRNTISNVFDASVAIAHRDSYSFAFNLPQTVIVGLSQ